MICSLSFLGVGTHFQCDKLTMDYFYQMVLDEHQSYKKKNWNQTDSDSIFLILFSTEKTILLNNMNYVCVQQYIHTVYLYLHGTYLVSRKRAKSSWNLMQRPQLQRTSRRTVTRRSSLAILETWRKKTERCLFYFVYKQVIILIKFISVLQKFPLLLLSTFLEFGELI